MPVPITPVELERALAQRDLTDPVAGPHALQLLVADAVAALTSHWGCSAQTVPGERVVAVADNYDALLVPPDAVGRDERYSRYVDDARMLRGHMSAAVPSALRALRPPHRDTLLVCAGVVYRRDSIDRLHTGTPHQLDLWRVGGTEQGPAAVADMVDVLMASLLPGRLCRTVPAAHPYTQAGRQIDVDWDGTWVEVGECGLAHPGVLAQAGPPRPAGGLALGLGLDRILMVRKGIPDIRLLASTDPRVAVQMLDLGPYRAVSSMPPVRRDLSVAVDSSATAEELGGRVRDALGPDADAVEEVAVVSETHYDGLPEAARRRLGIRPGEKNVLLRVVLRHPTQTLTGAEANQLRDRVAAALGDRQTGSASMVLMGVGEGMTRSSRNPARDSRSA